MVRLRSLPPTLTPETEAAITHLRHLAAQNSELKDALAERGVAISLPEDEERVTLDTVCRGMLPARFFEAQRDTLAAFHRCIREGSTRKLKGVFKASVTFTYDPQTDALMISADTTTTLPRGQAQGEIALLGSDDDNPFRRIDVGGGQTMKLPFRQGE
jgi:hypothetical protein